MVSRLFIGVKSVRKSGTRSAGRYCPGRTTFDYKLELEELRTQLLDLNARIGAIKEKMRP
jgi:hypothetical protein